MIDLLDAPVRRTAAPTESGRAAESLVCCRIVLLVWVCLSVAVVVKAQGSLPYWLAVEV